VSEEIPKASRPWEYEEGWGGRSEEESTNDVQEGSSGAKIRSRKSIE
jgi:hypothetical protein